MPLDEFVYATETKPTNAMFYARVGWPMDKSMPYNKSSRINADVYTSLGYNLFNCLSEITNMLIGKKMIGSGITFTMALADMNSDPCTIKHLQVDTSVRVTSDCGFTTAGSITRVQSSFL
jgi:hypothetical protein